MSEQHRKFSPQDLLVAALDDALRTVFGKPPRQRPTPKPETTGVDDTKQKKLSARLMRVNHSGEVCAQALYHAQSITARSPQVSQAMKTAAEEENDHLRWCEERLQQLDDRKSYLNPVWYMGSFAIGSMFGLLGDRWSLGFLAETEKQVVVHLEGHLQRLPDDDHISRTIIEKMREDEEAHATQAVRAGGRDLPSPVKRMMAITSRIMTTTAANV